MAGDRPSIVQLRPTRPCPICEQHSDRRHYPFCSERCANRDLNRWLSGGYAIPARDDDDIDSSDAD